MIAQNSYSFGYIINYLYKYNILLCVHAYYNQILAKMVMVAIL